MKLLLQAAKIELAYYQMQGFVHNVVFMRKKWEKRIKAVKSNFEAIDRSVKYKYQSHDGGSQIYLKCTACVNKSIIQLGSAILEVAIVMIHKYSLSVFNTRF
jgi:hypothetical protein